MDPMPKPYSIDLRKKIVAAYENKEGSMQKLADRFKVSKNFVADNGSNKPDKLRPNDMEVDILHQ